MLILSDFFFFIWLNIKLIHKFGFVPIRCSNMLDLFWVKKWNLLNQTIDKFFLTFSSEMKALTLELKIQVK